MTIENNNTQKNSPLTNTEIDSLMEKLHASGPLLSCEDMDLIEKQWEETRRTRRCALVLLTKSFDEFDELVRSDKDFAVSVAELAACSRSVGLYKGLQELLDQFDVRALCALAGREDMSDILASVE